MDRPGRWATVPDRHLQRIDHQLGADVVRDRPAHDAAAEAVDDDREVQPPLTCAVLGHVGDVEPVWGIGAEVPLDQVLRWCRGRSEEHTSELQSLMRISYAVFCLKKKNKHKHTD